MTTKKSEVTFGRALAAYRVTEELTQTEVAATLGISTAYLSDLENGRRKASVATAAQYAKALGMPAATLVALVLQDEIREVGLKYRVTVEAE